MAKISDYAILCSAIYDEDPSIEARKIGWLLVDENGANQNMRAGVFSKNQAVVVAFRGTRFNSATDFSPNDLLADLQLGVGYNTSYFSQAEQYAALHAPGSDVVFVGHSLGGAIAQTVGNRTRRAFVTFNAPGVALIASQNIKTVNPIVGTIRLAIGVSSALATPMQSFRDARSAFHDSLGTNYRLSGDRISEIGLHYGPIVTLPAAGDWDEQHKISSVINVLGTSGAGETNFPS